MNQKELFIEYVENLGFNGLPLGNYYDSIKQQSVEVIEVKNYEKKFDDDSLNCDIVFRYNEHTREPAISSFTATLRHIPPIQHGIYNGVDSQKLEQALANVDWHNKTPMPTETYSRTN